MTPEKLIEAMDKFSIHDNSGYSSGCEQKYKAPTLWYVVNDSKAEPEVNWPGELISEHETRAAAKVGLAAAIIKCCETDERSTLARGDEIEADFYMLKAQEWAVEPEEAKRLVLYHLESITREMTKGERG